MNKRKIAVIGSSRATYGYKRRLLKEMVKSKKIELQFIVTGMHLMRKHGNSINEIVKDKIPISKKIPIFNNKDSNKNFVESLGIEIQKLSKCFQKLKPHLVLVTGDRAEMFAATFAAVYMNIPVAHIQSGDVSGHIDGSARHAITKLAHIHLPSCKDSADRVLKMGEEKWRIFNVGAPQLDDLINSKKYSKQELYKKLGLNENNKIMLVIQHPVLVEHENSKEQVLQTLEATKNFNFHKIVIYPNVDSGSQKIISQMDKYKNTNNFSIFNNLERKLYLSLLKHSSLLIGNSSSGILEASSFKIPVINIGNRQRGRLQADNVINCSYSEDSIKKAINKAISNKSFIAKVLKCKNPYGDGKSSKRILKILETINIDDKLLDKKIIY
tara:strand:- start:2844 stop:3995 length:1152 start_codon:yes stop_codon:yes gene_type:complete